jgi:hypothetical protein
MNEGNEKRRSIRVSRPLFVQFGLGLGSAIMWDESLVKDISETGICIRTSAPIEKDEICYLRFKVPQTKETVAVSARAIGSSQSKNTYFTRLEFINLDEEQQRLLREYIEWTLENERGEK